METELLDSQCVDANIETNSQGSSDGMVLCFSFLNTHCSHFEYSYCIVVSEMTVLNQKDNSCHIHRFVKPVN